MPAYPTDIAIDRSRDIYLDDANDLAVVSGRKNLEQSVAISASDAIEQFVGGKITGTNIALLEERVRQTLDDNPMVGDINRVDVEEFDRRTDALTVTIELDADEEFEIEVST